MNSPPTADSQALPSGDPGEALEHVVVVGGGISGLSAAHRLTELSPTTRVTLCESAARAGGVLETVRREPYLIERSADMFTAGVPWAKDLCERIGMGNDLLTANPRHRRAFVFSRGRLHPVPDGFALLKPSRVLPILASRLLTWRGKLRLLRERWVPAKTDGEDESLASFARRRLGPEAFDRLVQPLVGGIYTADPERLSMQATMPQFLEMERRHGSLSGAALGGRRDASERKAAGARYDMFLAPREGFQTLIDAVTRRLPRGAVRCGAEVRRVTREGRRWRVDGADGASLLADGVIVATPAPAAAKLLAACDPQLSAQLAAIPYAGASVLALGYRREQIGHPLNGFGCVIPLAERREVLAVSFSSVKYEGRAPKGRVLLRVFVGGAMQGELANLPDPQLTELARRELATLLRVRGEPEVCEIIRWPGAMPQYHVGHQQRVEEIERLAAAHPGLELAGNAYRGVGIPFCVRSGEQAAARILGREAAPP